MSKGKICIVTTTTNDQKTASMIGHKLIEERLAACVQIEKINSIFFWEGEIQSGNEFRIILKTTEAKYKALESTIMDLHNYELPQIIKQYVDGGLQEYLEWIHSRVA